MTQRIATIDTSVLLSLQCTNTLGTVSVLFNRVLVPRAVWEDVQAGGERNLAAAQALRDHAFFHPCEGYDAASVRLLLDTRRALRQGKDRGEAEAVIQAS